MSSKLPETETFVSTTTTSRETTRGVAAGTLRKLASKLYTRNLIDPPQDVVRRNLWAIVAGFYPDALITDRTALEFQPAPDGSVFFISAKLAALKLPGVILRPRKGHPPLPSDVPFMGNLRVASPARALLENLIPRRARESRAARTLNRIELEQHLDRVMRRKGEEELNALRDAARVIAPSLELTEEFKTLTTIIGALLSTNPAPLKSFEGKARQAGLPYDPNRLHLFQTLLSELKRTAPIRRVAPPPYPTPLPFFEAYFSNFIEGTEFEVDDAEDIVFRGRIPKERPQDAHDILGTFRQVTDVESLRKTPRSPDEFEALLQQRHAAIMAQRPETSPGRFKGAENRAGSTVFVTPELVRGTLSAGFTLARDLDEPFHRAVFLMFLIAEVHPFKDGNGRTARVFMNAELVRANECRIIIPTVYRDNYLAALKALTHTQTAEPLVRMLDFAQKFTAQVDWTTLEAAKTDLTRSNAFLDAKEAEARGIRLKLPH